jgi:hypothetical protein
MTSFVFSFISPTSFAADLCGRLNNVNRLNYTSAEPGKQGVYPGKAVKVEFESIFTACYYF